MQWEMGAQEPEENFPPITLLHACDVVAFRWSPSGSTLWVLDALGNLHMWSAGRGSELTAATATATAAAATATKIAPPPPPLPAVHRVLLLLLLLLPLWPPPLLLPPVVRRELHAVAHAPCCRGRAAYCPGLVQPWRAAGHRGPKWAGATVAPSALRASGGWMGEGRWPWVRSQGVGLGWGEGGGGSGGGVGV